MSHEPGKRRITTDTGGLWYAKGTVVNVGPVQFRDLDPEEDGDSILDPIIVTEKYANVTGEIWTGTPLVLEHAGTNLDLLIAFSEPTRAALTKSTKRNTR